MRRPIVRFVLRVVAAATMLSSATAGAAPPSDESSEINKDQQILRSAGLDPSGASLVRFFRTRAQTTIDPQHLLSLVHRFTDPAGEDQASATSELLAWGPLAVPVLRRAANDLDNPPAAARAAHCLHWLQEASSDNLPIAAAHGIALTRPEGAAEALLGYLPFADNAEVAHEVAVALVAVACPRGRPDPALVRGLDDTLSVRRGAACVALCQAGQAPRVPAVRKLLHDPVPRVRLQAALALGQANEATAIPVLIDLLAELPADERKPVEDFLQQLAGDWAPAQNMPGEDEIARKVRRDAWAAWWKNTDGTTLLAALRKRTFTPADRQRVSPVISKLSDERFAVREQATAELVRLGPVAVPLLRQAERSADAEVVRRARLCIQRINKDPRNSLPLAAIRLLAVRKPDDAVDALLAYLPQAEDPAVPDAVRQALAVLARDGDQLNDSLLRALHSPLPLVRWSAAEALVKGGGPEGRQPVRPLLEDKDTSVRLQVALALLAAQDREAIPALIGLLTTVAPDQIGVVEDALYQLAGDSAPPTISGEDDAARKKRQRLWLAWWKENGEGIDLARFAARQWLGLTLILEIRDKNGTGRVMEVGRDGKQRWAIDDLAWPVDAWVLPGKRVLIAESGGQRVTERDFQGKILWQKETSNGRPLNVQRLPNGGTFIATNAEVMELDRNGKVLLNVNTLGQLDAAYKARNGQIVCLTLNGQCIILDAAGKQVRSFPSNRAQSDPTSGIDLLPNGRILITQAARNKVAEVDYEGKTLLEVEAPNISTATALPNGHILATSYKDRRTFELDRSGKVVWELKSEWSVYRARRR